MENNEPEIYEYTPTCHHSSILDPTELNNTSSPNELDIASVSVSASKSNFLNKQSITRQNVKVYSDESSIQKLQRLELEMFELRQELEESQTSKTESNVLKKMDDLQRILGGLVSSHQKSLKEFKNLESLNKDFTLSDTLDASSSNPNDTSNTSNANNLDNSQELKKWMDLEKRIASLEEKLGTSVFELYSQPPIISHLQEMQSQLSILSDPLHMEQCIQKLKNFDSKKDVSQVLELQKTLDSPLIPLIPSLLDRLETLKSVHDSAIQMEGWMNVTSERVEKGNRELIDLKKNMQQLQQTIKENSSRMTENIQLLQLKLNNLS